MLHLIGTGLYYLNDLPLRALDIISKCDDVFLERYTNFNDIGFLEELEKNTGNKINIIGREVLESSLITDKAVKSEVALLVPGDPLAATTHFSLIQECRERGIKFSIIHASSIFSAVGETGLSMYKFGGTTSIPIYTKNFHPESFFDIVERNIKCGYHTLILLEVKDGENFVKPAEAIDILRKIETKKNEKIIAWENVIVLSKIGSDAQIIKSAGYRKINEMKPPCAIIIPGTLNKNEEEAVEFLKENS